MFLGWQTIPVDRDGMPCQRYTGWEASCFVFFFWIIYVGEVKRA